MLAPFVALCLVCARVRVRSGVRASGCIVNTMLVAGGRFCSDNSYSTYYKEYSYSSMTYSSVTVAGIVHIYHT